MAKTRARATPKGAPRSGSKHGGGSHPGAGHEDTHHGACTCCGVDYEVKGNLLTIAGYTVHADVDENRVFSHDMAYLHFGSMHELAEALIRDWGSAKIDHTPSAPHDHDDGDGPHDHDDGDAPRR